MGTDSPPGDLWLYKFHITSSISKRLALVCLALQCIFHFLKGYYFDECLINCYRIIPTNFKMQFVYAAPFFIT